MTIIQKTQKLLPEIICEQRDNYPKARNKLISRQFHESSQKERLGPELGGNRVILVLWRDSHIYYQIIIIIIIYLH